MTAPDLTSPAPDGLTIRPVTGLPDFRPGDDLAAAIATAAPWLADGDVLIVTSKVLSKVEGRLVPSPTDPEERDAFRRKLIDEQTVRLVAQVGRTRIVENRLGIVAAAAGIDASNVRGDEIALLPEDPDASAAALVTAFAARGLRIGVVVTDTQGRAWRSGVGDVAIGAAGVRVLDDHRGGVDEFGNQLVVTQVAVGDEIAAAGDLVKGKLSGVPVAVLTGMSESSVPGGTGLPGGRSLIRPHSEDLFRLGTDLAIAQGRREAATLAAPVTAFTTEPVDEQVLADCAAAAGGPVRLILVRQHRDALTEAMTGSWEADLAADGLDAEQIAAKVAGGAALRSAAELVVPVIAATPSRHTDDRRAAADRSSTLLAAGAALERFRIALAAAGLGSFWTGSTLFAPTLARSVLDLTPGWEPLGAIGIGHPDGEIPPLASGSGLVLK